MIGLILELRRWENEFDPDNLHPTDRLIVERDAALKALQAAMNGLEYYVEQDNGSHAVTVLNKIADIMGYDRKR